VPLEPRDGDGAEVLLRLLAAEGIEEWRHKVGVVGAADGSAKASTRLVAAQGWVLKTNIEQGAASPEALEQALLGTVRRGLSAGVWHHSKRWFALRSGERWYPVTLCRELATLRRIETFVARTAAWSEMIVMALRIAASHGVGLDLGPANFGRDAAGELYYLDDELYPALGATVIASAIASRIPEEPERGPEDWTAWGRSLALSLATHADGSLRAAVIDELAHYPTPPRFLEQRSALLTSLREVERSTWRGRSPSREPAQRVCLLADVHANYPALDAVLREAEALGADEYLFLGDAVGYGPHPGACVERLADLSAAIFVRGNHDHAIATGRFDVGMNRLARQCAHWTRDALSGAHLAWLMGLAIEHRAESERWIAVHGAPRDPHRFLAYVYELTYEDNLRHLVAEDRAPLCFCGHTHVQIAHLETAGGPTKLAGLATVELEHARAAIVNPGSVGQPRDGLSTAAFALWHRSSSRVTFHRVAYDIARTVADMRRADLPAELVSRLERGV
jgi:diadenosine tetraphosphatase ApaH/serine/threonine PP2A family protein phosphatase